MNRRKNLNKQKIPLRQAAQLVAAARTARRAPPARRRRGTDYGAMAGALGSTVGNLVSPGIGGTVGGYLGRGAHALFKRITGYGDYTVNSNSLLTDSVPQFGGGSERGVRVRHREYIQDITSHLTPGAFNLTKIPIQLGLSQFPWASGMARSFEEVKIHGMIFEYKTMSANALNSTNTSLGTIIMSTKYNVNSPDFTAKVDMENAEFACSCVPSQSMIHPIECSPKEMPMNILFLRSGPVEASADLQKYDLANFFIAATAVQGSVVTLGELWCSYDVEFFKPKRVSIVGNNDHFKLGAVTTNAPLGGSAFVTRPGSNFGCTRVNASTLAFPYGFVGSVIVSYSQQGVANASGFTLTATGSAGVTTLGMGNGGTAFNWPVPTGGNKGDEVVTNMAFAVNSVLGVNETLTFTCTNSLTVLTNADLFIWVTTLQG